MRRKKVEREDDLGVEYIGDEEDPLRMPEAENGISNLLTAVHEESCSMCDTCDFSTTDYKAMNMHRQLHPGVPKVTVKLNKRQSHSRKRKTLEEIFPYTRKVATKHISFREVDSDTSNTSPGVIGKRRLRKTNPAVQDPETPEVTVKRKRANRKVTNKKNQVFHCDLCEYTCRHANSLTYHKLSHNGATPFACKSCEYKTKTRAQLKSHRRTHKEDAPIACKECSYRCKFLAGLRYHMLSHQTEVLSCDQCKFTTKSPVNLESHKRKHSSEKPLTCDQCTYCCRYPAALVHHKLSHVAEKLFTCEYCAHSCRSKRELNAHTRSAHDKLLYKCKECHIECNSSQSFRIHMKTHHPELS